MEKTVYKRIRISLILSLSCLGLSILFFIRTIHMMGPFGMAASSESETTALLSFIFYLVSLGNSLYGLILSIKSKAPVIFFLVLGLPVLAGIILGFRLLI